MAKLTGPKRAELKARLDQEWWDKWWAQDFSWAGLAALNKGGHPIHPWQGWSITPDGQVMEREDPALPEGSRDATLQDYWRWNGQSLLSDENLLAAGLLEDHDDQPRFHICHLPEHWKDGADSWKTNAEDARWQTLKTELAYRIRTAARTEVEKIGVWENETLIGPDRRAQLSGAQIRTLPRPPAPSQVGAQTEAGAYHLRADYTRWLAIASFNWTVFGSPTRFDNAQFSSESAFFFEAQFSGGHADFRFAQFSGGDANFRGAQFSGGDASFYKAQFSGGDASFYEAQFSGGDAEFYKAQFSGGDANLQEAQFSGGDADFRFAQFSGGYASFDKAQFSGGDASVRDAQFSGGYASFDKAQFSGGDASVRDAQFSGGYASFDKAQFSGGDASFRDAQFSGGYASFDKAQFSGGDASFRDAQFSGGYARFDKAQFSGGYASFYEAQFSGGDAEF
ncbi:pentapeptide repeat-containing protein [Maricaulis sp. D1M11]|uniref:pentapeptide repeat-containing protein n=1 Tax=Maricaulis sp. D1M11 TaxID=3076117 RepID=UPI0039B37962